MILSNVGSILLSAFGLLEHPLCCVEFANLGPNALNHTRPNYDTVLRSSLRKRDHRSSLSTLPTTAVKKSYETGPKWALWATSLVLKCHPEIDINN